MVALDEEDETIYFGECKGSRNKVSEKMLAELVGKSKLVEWNAGKGKEGGL